MSFFGGTSFTDFIPGLGGALGSIIGRIGQAGRERRQTSLASRRDAAGASTDFDQYLARLRTEDPAFALNNLLEGISTSARARWGGRNQSLAPLFDALRNPNTYGLQERPEGGYTYTAPHFAPTYLDEKGRMQGGSQRNFDIGAPAPAPAPQPQPQGRQSTADFYENFYG